MFPRRAASLVNPSVLAGAVFQVVALAFPVIAQQPHKPTETPREIVAVAVNAANGDSISVVKRRWQARVNSNPNDHLAALGIATLARLSYDYEAADEQYEALAATLDAPAIHTYARLGQAQSADTRGIFTRADSLYPMARQHAQRAHDPLAEAEALLGWAFTRAQVMGVEAGFALLDSAAALLPQDTSPQALRARYLMGRAVLRAVTGQPQAGEDAAMARAITRQIVAPRLEARALRSLALVAKLQRNDARAIALLDTAAMIQRRVHDRSGLAETLLRQRESYLARMDLGKAKALSLEAAQEARASKNEIAFRSVILGLGTLSLHFRDYPAADAYLARAIDLCRTAGDTTTMMLARSQRVDLYLGIGDFARAFEEKRAVVAYHHAIGDQSEEFEALRELLGIYVVAGDLPNAEATLQRAEELARAKPQWHAALDYDRGILATARGEWSAADRFFTRTLQSLEDTEHLRRYVVRTHRAHAYAQLGRLRDAERELFDAGAELDRWRSTLKDSDLRKLVFQATGRMSLPHDTYLASAVALLIQDTLGPSAPRIDAALRVAQQYRARELADRLLRSEDTRPVELFEPIADDSVWHALIPDRKTAVLHYLTGAGNTPTTAFVVDRDTKNQIRVRARTMTPADSLAPQIARFVALLESGADPGVLGRELGKQLLDPVVGLLDSTVHSLIVVPHGPVHRVPFDALRLANNDYVVQRFAVSIAPSANVIAALRRRGAVPARPVAMLVFGNPNLAWSAYVASDSILGLQAFQPLESSVQSLPPLKGAAREAAQVAQFAPRADVKLGIDASAPALLQGSLDQYRILHFATHAIVDNRSDARTALVLSAGNSETGFVSPDDIAALHLAADLVVLSACRSGGGVTVDGEGVQGLTTAFLEAGAQSVIASHWQIADGPIVPLMESLYSKLADGLSVSDALRAAKLEAIARGDSPRDWAALTLVGDPGVTIQLQHPPRRFGWWVPLTGGLVLIGLAGLLTWWVRRKQIFTRAILD